MALLQPHKFTQVNVAAVAVRCVRRHFLILYACAHSHFPKRKSRSETSAHVTSLHDQDSRTVVILPLIAM